MASTADTKSTSSCSQVTRGVHPWTSIFCWTNKTMPPSNLQYDCLGKNCQCVQLALGAPKATSQGIAESPHQTRNAEPTASQARQVPAKKSEDQNVSPDKTIAYFFRSLQLVIHIAYTRIDSSIDVLLHPERARFVRPWPLKTSHLNTASFLQLWLLAERSSFSWISFHIYFFLQGFLDFWTEKCFLQINVVSAKVQDWT